MTAFFTVSTVSHLPQAITMLDSVRRFHPEFTYFIGLADYILLEELQKLPIDNRYKLIQLHELNFPEFSYVTSNYTPFQLANSSKTVFSEYILKNYDIHQLIYADADMLFYKSLDEVLNNTTSDIIITPHFLTPPSLSNQTQELEVLTAGLYNSGFVKLLKSQVSFDFLTWWKERSLLNCIEDRINGIYFEQHWLNFVPLYFPSTTILRDLGYNVAYWNLHERSISKINEMYMINETVPLTFFHFSGWRYAQHETISVHSKRHTIETKPYILPLLLEYKELLQQNNYESFADRPNYYFFERHLQEKKSDKPISRLKKFLGF